MGEGPRPRPLTTVTPEKKGKRGTGALCKKRGTRLQVKESEATKLVKLGSSGNQHDDGG